MNKEDIIQKFLQNSLTEEEKKFLDEEKIRDSEFANEIEEAITLKKAIIAHKKEVLRETFKTIENQKKIVRFPNLFKYGIAASFVISLISILYFFLVHPISNEKLFAENFEPYRNIIIPIERNNTPKSNSNKEYVAFYEYEIGNYETACNQFSDLYKIEQKSYYLFYKAICELELNRTKAAITSLSKHQETNDSFKEKGKWYLALAYLKNNEISNSKTLLNEIIDQKSYNYKKAEELIQNLNKN